MGESGHGAAPRRSRALTEETKRELSQRMGRLVLWLALAVLLPAPAILQPLEQAVLEEHEQMKELLTRMFVDNHREGRDLEEDVDEEEEQTNLVDEESDNEEAVETVSSNDPQEIARFNNYMDAIYRRMNAALRAKLMDPMVLNMNAKVSKKDKKDKKKRVERSADLEEDAEEKDKEAKKLARKEKKKKRKNKKNKKDKKDKKERKKELSPEKLKKKEERERKRMEKKAARKAAKKSRVERSADEESADVDEDEEEMEKEMETGEVDRMVKAKKKEGEEREGH